MQVVVLLSQKGGSGKTTLAGHIAVQAERAGAGPVFHAVKVKTEEAPLAMPPKEAVHLKDRFRQALLGHV